MGAEGGNVPFFPMGECGHWQVTQALVDGPTPISIPAALTVLLGLSKAIEKIEDINLRESCRGRNLGEFRSSGDRYD